MKRIECFRAWIDAARARHGIRSRIMQYLLVFVAFTILLLWLFQVVLLQDFYRAYKLSQVTRTARAMEQNIGSDSLSALAEELSARHEVCIMLLDERYHPAISAEGLRGCLLHHMSAQQLHKWAEDASGSDKPVFRTFATSFRGTRVYDNRRYVGDVPGKDDQIMAMLFAEAIRLPDGSKGMLLINASLTPVTATVDTIRRQLMTVTAILLLAAILLAWLISRHVSRPIIETSRAAHELGRSRYTPPASGHAYREVAQLNDTLSRAADELSKVERLQQELVANVSHDLRTPLTMIGGYAEVMRDIPDETTPENLQIIIDETARLSSLVNELLDFSRLQAGSETLQLQPFDLTAAVMSDITRIGKLTEKDGYVIRFEPEAHVRVTADEQRITQVIYNLIGNALTYTGEDRTVTVCQELRGNAVRVSVTDTGKGIPAEELPFIWNRYYRTHETHRRAVVGSGLGLNIVHSILEKHGAAYGVTSEQGKGTTFWFELPAIFD